nr:pilus assembly protein TadG-related protein [Oleiagrimonas soli]
MGSTAPAAKTNRLARLPRGCTRVRLRVRGQAFVLGMMALLVLCVGVIVLFNTGQSVNTKVQLVNTADAAAYSAAVQQARAYNLMAYMNRATVANEIAMAQMVSWYSWTNFAISGTAHLRDALIVISIPLEFFGVGEVLDEIAADLQEAKSYLEEGRNLEQKLFDFAATVEAFMNGTYARSSQLIGDAGSADTVNLATKIVKMNDPNASIPAFGIALLGKDAVSASALLKDGYVHRYTIPLTGGHADAGANRFRNVVMEARDPFSRERNGSFLFGLFKKRGGTDLVDYRNWVGLDTLNFEFHCPIFLCGVHGFPPHGKHFDIPLAWGGGAAIDKQTRSFASLARRNPGWDGPYVGGDPEYATKGHYDPYAGAMGNGAASRVVLSNPAENGNPWIKPMGGAALQKLGGTVGLPDYNDITDDHATVPYLNGASASDNGVSKLDVGPVFTVLVVQNMDTVHTSDHLDHLGNDPASASSGVFGGGPDFRVKDQTVSDQLSALGSAQVYFSRSRSLFPSPVDPRRELGSLFSPYWQARLIDTPCDVRQAVAIRHGMVSPCKPTL